MSYEHDLRFGEATEKVILSKVREVYPKAYKPEDNSFDIVIPETGQTMEIKTDRGSKKSPNIAVETSCKGKPSGIYGPADLWAQVFYSDKAEKWIYFIVRTKDMKDFAENQGHKTTGGDNNDSELLLLEKVEVEKYFRNALRKF